MLDQIDLKDGVISYDTFSWLKDNNQVKKHKHDLSEDLLQINFFNEKYIIDVGWYGCTQKSFSIVLIQKYDWEKPLFKSSSQDLNKIYSLIKICVKIIYKLESKSDH